MKTFIILVLTGNHELNYFVVADDHSHLDGLWINKDSQERTAELTELLYEEGRGFRHKEWSKEEFFREFREETRCPIITVGSD